MPELYLFGGPNGAGKTTTARTLLPRFLALNTFVNADDMASALSPLSPEEVARLAARLVLERLELLSSKGENFAFETALASRGLISILEKCRTSGYTIHLIYIWLSSADLAVERVKVRVRSGGHSIPEDVIRRRYERGRDNFLKLYAPACDTWLALDNSVQQSLGHVRMVAEGGGDRETVVHQAETWRAIQADVLAKEGDGLNE